MCCGSLCSIIYRFLALKQRLRRSLSCVGFFHVEASVSTVFPLAATVLELVDPNRLRRYKRGKKVFKKNIIITIKKVQDK